MDSFFSRFQNALVLIVLLAAQTLGLAVQVQRPQRSALGETAPSNGRAAQGVSLLRTWTAAIITPFERVAHETDLHVRNGWHGYLDLRHTREQNAALQQEVARLRLEQAAFAEDAAQGRRLQALLAFKQQYIAQTVAAQVIGGSGSDRSRVVYLDKGSADGLKPDMPVITPDGVVGKLSKVDRHTAQLLLLNDLTSGAGVTLVSSRLRAIVQGAPGGHVEIDDLMADPRIKPGEHVVTSGGDEVFPRGLPVGVIESIGTDRRHQPYLAIVVKPFANLARLEEVLVITGTSSTLPPQAEQDAEQASATAATDDAKRAADILAQRLPGLQTSPATGAAGETGTTASPATGADDDERGGKPGVPNSGLPPNQPALHPDRYSPGAAPPATDLKPGGPN